jgi:hypothetical protein
MGEPQPLEILRASTAYKVKKELVSTSEGFWYLSVKQYSITVIFKFLNFRTDFHTTT